MKKILYPNKADWAEMLRRPMQNVSTFFENVSTILKNVKANGDAAVLEYEEQFDKVKLASLVVTEEEMKEISLSKEELIERAIREFNNEADRIDEEYDRNTLN